MKNNSQTEPLENKNIKIKAVIFDMYETLITHYETSQYFGIHMAADAGLEQDIFLKTWSKSEDDRTLGKITLEELLEKILKENDCYSKEKVDLIAGKRKKFKEEVFEQIHPDIIPMLQSIKEQGILVGLISNCFSEEAEIIKNSVLFPYFDAVCLSYDEGVKKPDEIIFKRCMEKLNVSATECLYVGDGGSNELEAAKAVGMNVVQAAWYFKEGIGQQTKRKTEFLQGEAPFEILEWCR